ncbi:MAG TPA: MerR family transcriptional regulator [Gaiellales bacterium]|nr:MerR family transcriptional regulator [Gaiellales bacterium]
MSDHPRYSISVAAELVGMHPQTLRMYEARGLVRPGRTAGGTRRYSERDLERLRRVALLTELGMNLAGARHVLDLEDVVSALERRVGQLERRLLESARAARDEVDRVRASYRRDLILYQPPKHPQTWISRS